MADAVSRLTHLLDRKFIYHFCTHFPQSKNWRLLPLLSGCKQQLTTVLHNKQSLRGSLQPSSIQTQPPGTNGIASASGFKSPLTSNTLRTPFPSSKFLRAHPFRPSVRARATYQEEISRAIPPLYWSNLCICGGQQPPTQPHGEARLLAGTLDSVLSERGFSSNKSVSNPCQHYPSLGLRRPGNHRKKHCHQRSQLSRLLLPPTDRLILQGQY